MKAIRKLMPNEYNCDDCDMQTDSLVKLYYHFQTPAHRVISQGGVFVDPNARRRAQLEQESKIKKASGKYKCDVCDMTFSGQFTSTDIAD